MLTEAERLTLENQAFIMMGLSELLRDKGATITANVLLSRAGTTLDKVAGKGEMTKEKFDDLNKRST